MKTIFKSYVFREYFGVKFEKKQSDYVSHIYSDYIFEYSPLEYILPLEHTFNIIELINTP